MTINVRYKAINSINLIMIVQYLCIVFIIIMTNQILTYNLHGDPKMQCKVLIVKRGNWFMLNAESSIFTLLPIKLELFFLYLFFWNDCDSCINIDTHSLHLLKILLILQIIMLIYQEYTILSCEKSQFVNSKFMGNSGLTVSSLILLLRDSVRASRLHATSLKPINCM